MTIKKEGKKLKHDKNMSRFTNEAKKKIIYLNKEF